eukprot:TRINITY_DN2200_c0_g1_i1.p1 TRINITY_DN2200_c0_g1~~TRINITY_DN2200_c0_g1_i1.p1  ORF type:complete len:171 (+),score=24.99 TRINITY_DN2200_c0_g1_i1:220-732(+)
MIKKQKKKEIQADLWVELYKPKRKGDLIGNKTNHDRLAGFLKKWSKTQQRAVLLSGPPGIGETSSATLIAKELGYKVLELNASDARSAKSIKSIVAQTVQNHGIMEYTSKNAGRGLGKQVLIMDEVDGMSAGDQGVRGADQVDQNDENSYYMYLQRSTILKSSKSLQVLY